MKKRKLALVLSLVMTLGSAGNVFANPQKISGKDNKLKYIVDKGYVKGYEDGSFGYEKDIKRSEFAKLVSYGSGQKDLSEKLKYFDSLYTDVDLKHWANGVINAISTESPINNQFIIGGYPDKTFKPSKNITYAELAKILVVLSKSDINKEEIDRANSDWPKAWVNMAKEQGIFDDVNYSDINKKANRGDAFTMFYNALSKLEDLETYENISNKVYSQEEFRKILESTFKLKKMDYKLSDLNCEIVSSPFAIITKINSENIPEDVKKELDNGNILIAQYVEDTNEGKEIIRNAEFIKNEDGNYSTVDIDVLKDYLQDKIGNSEIFIKIK